MKRCSASPIMRERHIKSTYTAFYLKKITKWHPWGCKEIGALCAADGCVRWGGDCGNHYRSSSKVRHRTTMWPSDPTDGHMPERTEAENLIFARPCSQQCPSQLPKGGGNQMSIEKWTDEQNVVRTYTEMLFDLKRKVVLVTDRVYDPRGHRQPQEDKQCMTALTWGAQWSSHRQRCQGGCQNLTGGQNGALSVNGGRGSVWKDGKSSGDGWSHNKVGGLVPLICTLKSV